MEMNQNPGRLARVKRWPPMRPVILVLRPIRRTWPRALAQLRSQARYVWWRRLLGRQPIPPSSAFKSNTILEYARRFGTRTLVETGTYLGETIDACLGHFDHIWSIELDAPLFEAAVRRFRPWPHVTIVNGDSREVLSGVLAKIEGPILFWLDAHYSGGITARGLSDTPIGHELAAILDRSSSDDVILIDDARDFGHGDYPRIDAIAELIALRRPGWHFEIRDDIMRAHAAKLGPVPLTAEVPSGRSEIR